MWVVSTHGVANYPSALAVRGIGPDAHAEHGVEDPPLDRLEPVTDVGDSPRRDDRQRVGEEGLLHLLRDGDIDDLAGVVHLVGDELLLLAHGCGRWSWSVRSTGSLSQECDSGRWPAGDRTGAGPAGRGRRRLRSVQPRKRQRVTPVTSSSRASKRADPPTERSRAASPAVHGWSM